ncbi:MAG: 3-oxoacyl-ACP reductase [Pseudomonadota bacterium]|nr:3-oxoacyl-ACP reductase [Pseudomonadota bacterium]
MSTQNSNDRYLSFVNSGFGKSLASALGLPLPIDLERYEEGQSFVTGPVLIGGSPNAELLPTIAEVLNDATDTIFIPKNSANYAELVEVAQGADLKWDAFAPSKNDSQKFKALVFDATGIKTIDELKALYNFFHPVIRKMMTCGRIVVIGRTPEKAPTVEERGVQRALEGFIRAVGKEVRKAVAAQLIYVEEGAKKNIDSTLRFFLSPKSAYVSGQVVRINDVEAVVPQNWDKPLAGKVALVTGSARGIGEGMANVLARDGASVICLDIPPAEDDLKKVSARIDGKYITCDITAADAGQRIAEFVKENYDGKLDIIVHNAGVTRDKTLGRMKENLWDMVININLKAEEQIDEYLLDNGVIPEGGRIICVSSISGIAGNMGQTNYSTSKAGVIGLVEGMSGKLKDKGITVNAVAPGFIETQMTAAIPFAIREAGRRMNSMAQGGLPVDVAETVAWFANPGSQGVTGQVVRVCGQSLIGK